MKEEFKIEKSIQDEMDYLDTLKGFNDSFEGIGHIAQVMLYLREWDLEIKTLNKSTAQNKHFDASLNLARIKTQAYIEAIEITGYNPKRLNKIMDLTDIAKKGASEAFNNL